MIKKIYRILKKLIKAIKIFIAYSSKFEFKSAFYISFPKVNISKKPYLYINLRKYSHDLKIRNHFTDKNVLSYVFMDEYHLPPQGVSLSKDSVVVDLGSNIGLTIVHLKNIFPGIKVIGYEMDVENFSLAKRNTNFYDKVYLHNKAIWISNTMIAYDDGNENFDGYSISTVNEGENQFKKVRAVTLMDVIKENRLERIDYLKMDIEGAENDILMAEELDWLNYVNAINMEVHLQESNIIDQYMAILKAHGFSVWKDTKHWSCIMAVK